MKYKTLFDALSQYSASDFLPMHMPGHKRIAASDCLASLGVRYDITEIDGFDNLACPKGILAESMEYAASVWGAEKSFYLVGGSTEGILSGIYAATGGCGRIIMARNCHKSVYNAVEILKLNPVYVLPEFDEKYGIYSSVLPENIKKTLDENRDIKLVVITSPTYEGVISDISSIAEICHSYGVPLMVDEAHGTHLGLSDFFPKGAVKCGADIVVQSLHKTLSSLTQTAIMHVSGKLIDKEKVAAAVSIFGSSSPSYLFLASIDSCIKNLNASIFCNWKNAIYSNAATLSSIAKFHISGYSGTRISKSFDIDPSKLVIFTGDTDYSGVKLAKELRNKYKIEIEMACPSYVVAMTGAGESVESVARFACAISEIDSKAKNTSSTEQDAPLLPEQALQCFDALQSDSELVSFTDASGRISADYIMSYPPGIPILVPGEIISHELFDYISLLNKSGADVLGLHGADGDMVCCVREI